MRIAVVDFGSFVLPYDFHLISALADRGCSVIFFASETKFNPEFLEALRSRKGVEVVSQPVSSSVAGRGRALLAYLRQIWNLWRRRRDCDAIILQFCARWQAELPMFWLLRKKLIFTVHNAVPHEFPGVRYWPFRVIATAARELWFVSRAVADDFHMRYGDQFRSKSRLVQHGTLALSPDLPVVPYRVPTRLGDIAYWSTVKPYKGIELMVKLALDRQRRSASELLEVHGRWAPELLPLRRQLEELGVRVVDRYLTTDELSELLSRELVFLLPYLTGSQSGALYTLLHHGRFFIVSDVGDLGHLLRRFGLQALILESFSIEAVHQSMTWLADNLPYAVARFSEAQAAMAWNAPAEAALRALSSRCPGESG